VSAAATPTCAGCVELPPLRRETPAQGQLCVWDDPSVSTGKVTPISGFLEFLPEQRIVEQHVLDVIREVFELHGFASIETRAVEPVDRLLGKGGDADKEIYGISRLAADATDAREPSLGLHFDLTVPFARYVLENAGKLAFPFRRYQMQKSWRGERPQEGRYREFTQCDIDVVDVGQLSPQYEIEMPLVLTDVFDRLPIGDYIVQVNDRRIPQGFYRGLGIADIGGTLRIVDKLDKVSAETVRTMLLESGCSPEQADQCLALAAIRTDDLSFVDAVRALGVSDPLIDEGLAGLAAVVDAGRTHAPGRVVADLKLARGLDYYTGTVYEVRLVGYESWGAVAGGGRYDALATDGSATYPGVGISIGVSRLLGLLFRQGLVSASRSTPACVLVALSDEESRSRSLAIASALRSRGIPCEVAPRPDKFGKQIRYAARRGIPYVWFPGASDSDADSVKDIRSGEQVPAHADAWLPPTEDLRPTVVRATPA
jgi:histidyl-tRNA synthetase